MPDHARWKKYWERTCNSSAMVWYPKICFMNGWNGFDVNIPQTIIIPLKKKWIADSFKENFAWIKNVIGVIKSAREVLGPDLFVRTDQASGKHRFIDSCFIGKDYDDDKIFKNIIEVIYSNTLVNFGYGLPFRALMIREYIEPEYEFTAFFGKLPIAKEVRIIVKDGRIITMFPYWFEDPIEEWYNDTVESLMESRGITEEESKYLIFKRYGTPIDWKDKLAKLNDLNSHDVDYLREAAIKIGRLFEGAWSLDFMKGKDGKWYFIDMARAEISFIPEQYLEEVKKAGIEMLV